MNKLIAVIALFSSVMAHAAPVTITFDDPVNETYTTGPDPLVGSFAITERDGFRISGIRFVDGFLGDPGDRAIASQTFEIFGPPQAFPIDLYRNDGQAFSLLAADGFADGGIVLGQAAGGTVFKSDFSDIGSADWLNLSFVQFWPSGGGLSFVAVDNLVVNVVPIPPAIALFASALGWLAVSRQQAGARLS